MPQEFRGFLREFFSNSEAKFEKIKELRNKVETYFDNNCEQNKTVWGPIIEHNISEDLSSSCKKNEELEMQHTLKIMKTSICDLLKSMDHIEKKVFIKETCGSITSSPISQQQKLNFFEKKNFNTGNNEASDRPNIFESLENLTESGNQYKVKKDSNS